MKSIKENKNTIKIFAAIGFCLLGDAMLYTVLPTRIELFAFSGAQLGIILAANRIIRLFSNFWAASIYEKWNRTIPFNIAIVASIFITFSYGYFELFWQFLILRLLWGFTFSLLRLKALLSIFDSGLPENMHGKLSGIFRSMSRTGYMVGMIFGGYLADAYNFSMSAYLLAALSGLALVFIFGSKKETKIDKKQKEKFQPNPKINMLKLITSPQMFILMFMGFALNYTGLGLINSSYGLYLKNLFGNNILILGFTIGVATLNGILLSTQSLFNLVLSPFLGNIADKYSINKIIPYLFVFQGILMSLLSFFESKFIAILAPTFIFINTAFLMILLYINISNYQKSTVSKRMAGLTTAVDLGAALGPLSLIFLNFGLTLPVLYFLGALLLITAGILHKLSIY